MRCTGAPQPGTGARWHAPELPYGLVGFPVNYATGVAEPEPKEELDRLLALSAKVLPRLVLRTVEMLEDKDLAFDHGYVYRFEG